MASGSAHCDCCNTKKQDVQGVKLIKGLKYLCKDCKDDLRWTNQILVKTAGWIVAKMPKKFVKINKITVTSTDAIS